PPADQGGRADAATAQIGWRRWRRQLGVQVTDLGLGRLVGSLLHLAPLDPLVIPGWCLAPDRRMPDVPSPKRAPLGHEPSQEGHSITPGRGGGAAESSLLGKLVVCR